MALYEDEITKSTRTRLEQSILDQSRAPAQQPGLREAVSRPADNSAVQQRLSQGSAPIADTKAVERPLPPRNVPLNSGVFTAGPDGVSTAPPAERSLREKVNYTNPQMQANDAVTRSRLAGAGAGVEVPRPAAPPSAAAKYGRIGGAAIGPALAGLDVVRVARDPNSTMGDVAVQGVESTLKAAGGAAGAAALSPIPVVGPIAGGASGYKIMDETIRGLRAWAGLGPSPIDRISASAQAAPTAVAGSQAERMPVPDVNRQALQPGIPSLAAAPPAVTQPAPQQPAPQQQPAVRGVRQDAITAQAPQQYTLGENAVQIIRPGGNISYATFGPNGPEGEVNAEVFNQGKTGEYRATMVKSAIEQMADPGLKLADRRLSNQGEIEKQLVAERGATGRKQMEIEAPKPFAAETKILPADPTSGTPAQAVQTPAQYFDPKTRTFTQQGGNAQRPKEKPTAQTLELMKKTINDPKMRERFELRFGPLAEYGLKAPEEKQ